MIGEDVYDAAKDAAEERYRTRLAAAHEEPTVARREAAVAGAEAQLRADLAAAQEACHDAQTRRCGRTS